MNNKLRLFYTLRENTQIHMSLVRKRNKKIKKTFRSFVKMIFILRNKENKKSTYVEFLDNKMTSLERQKMVV